MLLGYLRRHYKIIILLVLFIAVFAVVFSLYQLRAEAVFYAAALCLIIGLVLFLIGYSRYVWRHRALTEAARRICLSLDGLPAPRGRLETDYQELVQTLFRETARVRSESDIARGEMLEYYTLWVHQIKTPISAMRLLLQTEQAGQSLALSAELKKIEQYVDIVSVFAPGQRRDRLRHQGLRLDTSSAVPA
jgi:signal transduction histidine kinase